MANIIDTFEELKSILDTVTFEQLRHMYGTGRSFTERNSQGDKKTHYRHGVMTEIGDIEVSVWMRVMEYIIKREDETGLYKNLCEWLKETYVGWFKTNTELTRYALELHSIRIFDRKEWVCYIAFNQKYRPEILSGE